MNVLDIVEVIADREEYRKDGIVKGRRGRVFDVIIERPGWRKVYFINFETMKDLGIFYVREEDLKVVDKLTDLNGKEVVLPVKEYVFCLLKSMPEFGFSLTEKDIPTRVCIKVWTGGYATRGL